MTRPTRKPDEDWAIELLLDALAAEPGEWKEPLDAPTDRPDLVLEEASGLRIACEITQVGRSEWFQWQNDRGLDLDQGKLGQDAVPREVDLWLQNAIAKKAESAPDYKASAAASETWLLVHGGMNKGYDFFNLNDAEQYDIPLLVKSALDELHPFDRIYVASVASGRIIRVFPFGGEPLVAPDITNPTVLKVMSVRMMSVTMGEGNTTVAIGREFTPARKRVLPLLDKGRMKA